MTENTKKKDKIVTVIIVIVVVFLIGFNMFSYFSASIMLPGKSLSFISGVDPERNSPSTIDLSSGDHIVNFWATWCRACVSEIKDLNKVSEKYTLHGVIKKPFKKDVYSAIDPAFKSIISEDDFFDEHYISVIPTTILVRNGVIVKVHTGAFSVDLADKWFASINE